MDRNDIGSIVGSNVNDNYMSHLANFCGDNFTISYDRFCDHLHDYDMVITEEDFVGLLDASQSIMFEQDCNSDEVFWHIHGNDILLEDNVEGADRDMVGEYQDSPDGKVVQLDESPALLAGAGRAMLGAGGIRKAIAGLLSKSTIDQFTKQLSDFAKNNPEISDAIMKMGMEAAMSKIQEAFKKSK